MTAKNILEPLPLSFYLRKSVVKIARDLLGKIIVTNFEGLYCSGRIVETEAYNGIVDKASHAYNSRRTNEQPLCTNRWSCIVCLPDLWYSSFI
jgi:3-methyladenine DNA glycosylase Mpg